MSVDQQIDNFFLPISDLIASIVFYAIPIMGQDVILLLVLLAGGALFFTFYFGLINIRLFTHAIDIVSGKFDRKKDDGHINSFQALMTSLSGTVGLGNIAGVAVAISIGGPGAVFWMIVLGLFSMSTKFVEVALALKYRERYDLGDGTYRMVGGPMYYLRHAFDRFNSPYLGKGLSVVFALCCIIGSIGGGVIFQANQAFEQFQVVSGGVDGMLAGKGWLAGLLMAVLVGVVVIGGIKSIASVSARLVPVMAVVYMLCAFAVIIVNIENLADVFVMIWNGAFDFSAGFGGILGVMLVGFQRAAFSNESGLGTAPIIYAAARAHEPIRQAIASMLGPFIDTVIVCTVTALMILISGAYASDGQIQGAALTSQALSSVGDWAPYLLAIVIFLFAYSTMITYAYISGKAVSYLFGQSRFVDLAYKLFYCGCAVLGTSAQLDHVINFTDSAFLSMAVPNMIGLFLMGYIVKDDLRSYLKRHNL